MTETIFRYDRTPTGELPGNSMIVQTEAALSALGRETYEAKQAADQAAADAAAAASDAEAAQDSAASAAANAQQAAESAAQVVSVAQQALTVAQQAEVTAGQAVTAAGQAAQSAQDAQTAAGNAASNAQTAAGAASQSAHDAQTAQGAASASQTAAENAQTSAGQAATIATQAQSAAAQSAQSAAAAQTAAETLASPNRYSAKTTSLTLSAGQTISITDLDNVNVAVGNKIIDAVGNIFSIASIDTANNRVTLASGDPSATPPDLGYWENPAVMVSGDQTVAGVKTFTSDIHGTALRANSDATSVRIAAEASGATNNRSAQVIARKTTASSEPGCVLISAPKLDFSDSTAYVFGFDEFYSPKPIICPTPAAGDNSTKVATTAFVAQTLSDRKSVLDSHVQSAANYVTATSGEHVLCTVNLDSSVARFWVCLGMVDLDYGVSGGTTFVSARINHTFTNVRTFTTAGGGVFIGGILDAESYSVAELVGQTNSPNNSGQIRGFMKVFPLI